MPRDKKKTEEPAIKSATKNKSERKQKPDKRGAKLAARRERLFAQYGVEIAGNGPFTVKHGKTVVGNVETRRSALKLAHQTVRLAKIIENNANNERG